MSGVGSLIAAGINLVLVIALQVLKRAVPTVDPVWGLTRVVLQLSCGVASLIALGAAWVEGAPPLVVLVMPLIGAGALRVLSSYQPWVCRLRGHAPVLAERASLQWRTGPPAEASALREQGLVPVVDERVERERVVLCRRCGAQVGD